MPLLRDDDLVRIDLPVDGEWVEVKRRLSRGDEVAVQRAIFAGVPMRPGEMPTIDAGRAVEVAAFATIERAIQSWSFAEPVTPAAIRSLDGESIDAIKAALNDLYPGTRSEDDRKNSSGSGAAPGSDAAPLPANLDGSR